MTEEENEIYKTNLVLASFSANKYYKEILRKEKGVQRISLRIAVDNGLQPIEVSTIIKDLFDCTPIELPIRED